MQRDLIIRACRDLQARNDNHGSWVDGVPDSFKQIRDIYTLPDDGLWTLTVEGIVKNHAVQLVLELLEKRKS